MTIDEAIAQAREKAKKIRENLINGNNLEPYESYCNAMIERRAKKHEQIAEWLELLKWYEQGMEDIPSESGVLPKDVYHAGYNKAIDDFAEKLNAKCDGIIKVKWDSTVAPISWAEAYADFKDDIDEIAEQLKAGGKNV